MECVPEIFKSLTRHNVRYVLVGGVALNLHGVGRATFDIDLVLEFNRENIDRWIKVVEELKLLKRQPFGDRDILNKKLVKEWQLHKNLMAFTWYHPVNKGFMVGVLIDPPVSFDELWKDKLKRELPKGGSAWLASPDHLMQMKLNTGRYQDQIDILHLKNLLDNRLEEPHISYGKMDDSAKLGLMSEFTETLREMQDLEARKRVYKSKRYKYGEIDENFPGLK